MYQNVANKVAVNTKKKKIVVVVSAMSGTTNNLIDLTKQVSKVRNSQEYDVVVSSGEQITAGLLSMALNSKNSIQIFYGLANSSFNR